MVDVPQEYAGREQSYLKHSVLREYLTPWGFKLGGAARSIRGRTTLWYVDTFAGPWGTVAESLDGTSVSIGLEVLATAQTAWRERGNDIDVGAVFVEKNPKSFSKLQALLSDYKGPVKCHALQGRFGDRTTEIASIIGENPAFLFIDPTGWRGAEMEHVRKLVSLPRRDVLINVMYNFINRFKNDGRPYIRKSLEDFFGLENDTLPADLSEEELMAFYRRNLKEHCGVRYSADLFIQHPTVDRTWFRLVIGGSNPMVIRLFRDVERKVVGQQSHNVRGAAKRRNREERTGQGELDLLTTGIDDRYARLNEVGKAAIAEVAAGFLRARGETQWRDLWPQILEDLHVTHSDANKVVGGLCRQGHLRARGWMNRQQVPTEDNVLDLAQG